MQRMDSINSNNLPFMKMHGLGNDFVVIDAREGEVALSKKIISGIADRHFGVGFDQLAVISKGEFDAHLTFYNADGSGSLACGNATRCIARYLMDETSKENLILTTMHGQIPAVDLGNGVTSVNMGKPGLEWNKVPLSENIPTLELPIEGSPTATGMGNPHCTFFVEDAEKINLEEMGPKFENHPLFPERTNVQFASIIARDQIRMRVWERGAGVTLASGSSSCATAVAANRKGLTEKKVQIELDGGMLSVDWRQDGVWMTGPTMQVFTGSFSKEFLKSL
ncbi:MAG: diaminopimelate epimerase [Paracoccaceae bacterium]